MEFLEGKPESGCNLAEKFPPTARTKENIKKALAIAKEDRVFIPLKEKCEDSSMEDSLTVSKVSNTSTQSVGKFNSEQVMSRLKGKGKLTIEDVTKALDKHLPVTSAVLGKKRKNDEVVITKVIEPPPKVESFKDSTTQKTWDDLTKEVSKLGSKFVEDVIEKGKKIEYEYQLKAFQLNADKMRMEEALESVKYELRDVQLEKSQMQVETQRQQKTVSVDLIEAQKQVASLSQEVADLTASLAAKEVDHVKAMQAAVQNAIDSTAKIIAENQIQMIKDHLDGNYTGWDLEEAEKELAELIRGDGEVNYRLTEQVADKGKELSKEVDSGEESEEEAVVEAPKKKKK